MTWPNFSTACRKDVGRVLRSGQLTAYRANGKRLEPNEGSQAWRLEREIEHQFKVRHAVAVNSGTAALHAALAAVLAGNGGEVITSPYTFSATASAILHAGGTPVFADVDPHTFCITKETVAPLVTKKTAAILPVHLFGYLPDLSGLLALGVPVLEDGCQSVGARRDGRFSGTVGLAGAGSLNGSKNVPAGEGGFITTNSDEIARKARLFINHGENFKSESVGYNYRMHEVVACVARHGLKELEGRNERRRKLVEIAGLIRIPDYRGCPKNCDVATKYHGHVLAWGGQASTELCAIGNRYKEPYTGSHNVHYVAPMKMFRDRAGFISRCAKRGLPIQQSYTTPLHRLKAFKKYATRKLPVVDELHDKTLCLLTTLTPDRPLSYAKWCAKVIREALE